MWQKAFQCPWCWTFQCLVDMRASCVLHGAAGLTLLWEEVCFSFESCWLSSLTPCLKVFACPVALGYRKFCGNSHSTSCFHLALVGLTLRREEACFSVLYVFCPTRLAVFSYGSLIFRLDSERSTFRRVLHALVCRVCSCFTESHEQVALF